MILPQALQGAAPSRARDWRAVRRLLVVRLDNLGDVLMATPAIAALRAGLPDATITLLASPSGAAALPFIPDLDETIAFAAPWAKHDGADPAPMGRAELELVGRLADARYDAAVIFTTCTQSALPAAFLCRLAGIPLRLAHCRENPYELLSDWVAETDVVRDGMRHEVDRQLDMVASVGFAIADRRLRFRVPNIMRAILEARLSEAGIDGDRPLIAVHPGATADSRRYPAASFGLAVDRIVRSSGAAVVLTGSAAERPLVDELRAAMKCHAVSFAGLLGLGELAALIETADVLLANNSGPAHIAAAVGTPVVDLYALTNPQHTPWLVLSRVLNHPVPCRNCLKSRCPLGHHDCLRKVRPDAVADAAIELLAIAGRANGTAIAAASP